MMWKCMGCAHCEEPTTKKMAEMDGAPSRVLTVHEEQLSCIREPNTPAVARSQRH
jgi:hypothetical protein